MTSAAASGGGGHRTLVIGCGFIGSHVVERLVSAGRSPVVLTRSRPPEDVIAQLADGDLHLGAAADPQALESALDGVESVVYSAGGLLPAASERDPELDARLTLEPLHAVLEALSRRPGVELIYISSGGTVYGEPERLPIDEDHPTRPRGSYGKLHLACEAAIERRRAGDALRARILRCSTVYGERQWPDRGQGAVVTFLHRIERDDPVDLYGEGGTVRDYIYVDDVARACVDLIGRTEGPAVLNVASGEGTSLRDLLRMCEEQVGRQARVVEHPRRSFEVERVVLDPTRIAELIGLEPTRLEEGVARTHQWLSSAVLETT
jgi:UDP-glucose 4-epimerase